MAVRLLADQNIPGALVAADASSSLNVTSFMAVDGFGESRRDVTFLRDMVVKYYHEVRYGNASETLR